MSVWQCPRQEMTLQKSTYGSRAETRPVFLTQMWISGETLCLNTTHSCRTGRKHGRAAMDRVFSEPGHYHSSWHHFLTPGTDTWRRAHTHKHTHTHTHTHTHITLAGVWCFRSMMQTPCPSACSCSADQRSHRLVSGNPGPLRQLSRTYAVRQVQTGL